MVDLCTIYTIFQNTGCSPLASYVYKFSGWVSEKSVLKDKLRDQPKENLKHLQACNLLPTHQILLSLNHPCVGKANQLWSRTHASRYFLKTHLIVRFAFASRCRVRRGKVNYFGGFTLVGEGVSTTYTCTGFAILGCLFSRRKNFKVSFLVKS